MMNIDKILGNNIRKYRTARNMTLKELSEKLHKSISTVSKYEKGDISLDMPTFIETAEILGVSPFLLLNGEQTEAPVEKLYASSASVLYMYTYDSQSKCIVQSLIEQYPSLTVPGTYKVQMFNDVKDFSHPGSCGGLYTGEHTKNGFLETYLLHNEVSQTEQVMISCVNNLVNPNLQIGLITGLSNYTMLPISFKTVISNTELTNKDKLINLLTFSKEDLQLIKKTNYLSVKNPV